MKQAVVGSGCFAPDPNSANPWDGDGCSGWGGGQTKEGALKTLCGLAGDTEMQQREGPLPNLYI